MTRQNHFIGGSSTRTERHRVIVLERVFGSTLERSTDRQPALSVPARTDASALRSALVDRRADVTV